MRSRWSAYCIGEVDYIISTTDSEGPQFQADAARWGAEIREFSGATRFEKLELREVGPVVAGEPAEVLFFAKLSRGGEDVSFVERSRFVRREGRWLYHSGVTSDAH